MKRLELYKGNEINEINRLHDVMRAETDFIVRSDWEERLYNKCHELIEDCMADLKKKDLLIRANGSAECCEIPSTERHGDMMSPFGVIAAVSAISTEGLIWMTTEFGGTYDDDNFDTEWLVKFVVSFCRIVNDKLNEKMFAQ